MKVIIFLGLFLLFQLASANIHLPPPNGQQVNPGNGDVLHSCPVSIGNTLLTSGCNIDIGLSTSGTDHITLGGGGDLNLDIGHDITSLTSTVRFLDSLTSGSANIAIGTQGDVTFNLGSTDGQTTLNGEDFYINGDDLAIYFDETITIESINGDLEISSGNNFYLYSGNFLDIEASNGISIYSGSEISIYSSDLFSIYGDSDLVISIAGNTDIIVEGEISIVGQDGISIYGEDMFIDVLEDYVMFVGEDAFIGVSEDFVLSSGTIELDSDAYITVHADGIITITAGDSIFLFTENDVDIFAEDSITIIAVNTVTIIAESNEMVLGADGNIFVDTNSNAYITATVDITISAGEDLLVEADTALIDITAGDLTVSVSAGDLLVEAQAALIDITAGDLSVSISGAMDVTTFSGDITLSATNAVVFDAHLATYNAGTRTLAFSGCGDTTPSTFTTLGTDSAGTITFTTTAAASPPIAACQVTVSYATAYPAGNVPVVLVTPTNQATGSLASVHIVSSANNQFVVQFTTASASTEYSLNYIVIDRIVLT